jgi:hypothetical protein
MVIARYLSTSSGHGPGTTTRARSGTEELLVLFGVLSRRPDDGILGLACAATPPASSNDAVPIDGVFDRDSGDWGTLPEDFVYTLVIGSSG